MTQFLYIQYHHDCKALSETHLYLLYCSSEVPAPVQAAASQLFIPKVPLTAACLHCCTASSSCQMFHELTEPAFSCRKCPEELAVYLSLHLAASRPPP